MIQWSVLIRIRPFLNRFDLIFRIWPSDNSLVGTKMSNDYPSRTSMHFCKILSDFISTILEGNAVVLQVSWKILEEKVLSCKILQEMPDPGTNLEENV